LVDEKHFRLFLATIIFQATPFDFMEVENWSIVYHVIAPGLSQSVSILPVQLVLKHGFSEATSVHQN
jgi:hypothetical protein